MEPVALDELFADLERQTGHLAQEKDVRLTVTAAARPKTVRADRTRLWQVLLILLDNALRHTPAGGTIAVTAATSGAAATIQIADTGEGIAPEHLPRIFERFYRAGRARSWTS